MPREPTAVVGQTVPVKTLGRFLLGVIALLGTLVGALAVALHLWPVRWVPLVELAALVPVLIAAPVIAVLAGVLARHRLRLVVSVAVLAAGVGTQLPLFVGGDRPEPHLTVATANLMVGTGDVTGLAALVGAQRVDVLAVQELTPEAAAAVARSSIAVDLPHRFERPAAGANGSAIYSRYPLRDGAALDGFILENLSAVLEVPGHGPLRLLALHPVAPIGWPAAELSSPWWAAEQDRVREVLHALPDGPVIAAGDFNATWDHALFRRNLTAGFVDATRAAGAGWLRTYPQDRSYPPVVGIDHVLLRGLSAASVPSHAIAGTDHRVVVARVG